MFRLPESCVSVLLLRAALPGVVWAQAAASSWATKNAPKAAGWAAAEKSVTKLEQDWFKIQLAHDWDKMRQLLGDDFQLIESNGTLGDRDSMIAGYREEAPSVVTIATSASRMSGYFATASGSVLPSNSHSLTRDR